MALITNNIMIKGQEQKVSEPVTVKAESQKPIAKTETTVTPTHEKNHVLIVNGKEKKVRKQSTYLIDMLTIDDQ